VQWVSLENIGSGITAEREANAAYLQSNAPGFFNPAFYVSAGFLMILLNMLFVRLDAVFTATSCALRS